MDINIYHKQLQSQIDKIEKEYQEAISSQHKLRKGLEQIAEKTCNFKYAQKQLGGPNEILSMGSAELRDFIIENILEQKNDFIKNIQDLQSLYLQEVQEKEELAKKILELQEALQGEKEKNVYQSLNFTSKQPQKTPPKHQNGPTVSNEELKDILTLGGGQVYDIQKEMNKLDIYAEAILKVIGEYGLSESKQIFEKVMEIENVKETTLKTKLNFLAENFYLECEHVSTILRTSLNLYGLTPLGQEIYRHLTRQQPIKAEKDKLKTQHSTLKHAYSIKDTATILEQLGYTNISYDSSQNQIKVAGSNRYVPDIIANFDENKKTYWEVELAHHTDGDFFEKLDKAAKVTDVLYIIAPDKVASDKLNKQIGRYKVNIMKKGLKTKLTIFLATMTQLKNRQIFNNKECFIQIG